MFRRGDGFEVTEALVSRFPKFGLVAGDTVEIEAVVSHLHDGWDSAGYWVIGMSAVEQFVADGLLIKIGPYALPKCRMMVLR